MNLKKWMDKNQIDAATVAKLAKVSVDSIYLWCKGKRTPREKHMRKLMKITNGLVRPEDFWS